MECGARPALAEKTPTSHAPTAEGLAASPASLPQSPGSPPDARDRDPEEKAKRPKHTRVHKREKELYGLVTPVFLPLLDARETSPSKKEKKKASAAAVGDPNTATHAESPTSSRDAEKSKEARKSRKEHQDMEGLVLGTPAKESGHAESVKKLKRSSIKKSSLRHKDTPRARRKRVSLVIDGQTVLPADTVIEPALTSPSSEATSASNSTASLDDMIDPRLTRSHAFTHPPQQDAVHHSLPLTMSHSLHSTTKPLVETPAPVIIQAEHSPPLPSPRSPSISFNPPQTLPRTFPDPSPIQPATIPELTHPDQTTAQLNADDLADDDDEPHWDTYVGGLHGSGVDDVDQAGSYGYPSSLGASYLESYMQNRPLSVRMQAADKAGLSEREKREMLAQKREEEEEKDFEMEIVGGGGRVREGDDDMDIVGSMEGF